ncbi:MAG TPA: hypothetical protein VJJ98_07520 [Sedimentisphaerales bacterium]|nr:hypothetical protein [Sedimentisphaerales bacterium]
MRIGTAILAVRFTRVSARRKKTNWRARMALRRMGKPHWPRRKASLAGLAGMPMPRQNGFSYTFLEKAHLNCGNGGDVGG